MFFLLGCQDWDCTVFYITSIHVDGYLTEVLMFVIDSSFLIKKPAISHLCGGWHFNNMQKTVFIHYIHHFSHMYSYAQLLWYVFLAESTVLI